VREKDREREIVRRVRREKEKTKIIQLIVYENVMIIMIIKNNYEFSMR